MAGIQKSLKKFEIKINGIQSAIQKYTNQKKPYEIVYRPFLLLCCFTPVTERK